MYAYYISDLDISIYNLHIFNCIYKEFVQMIRGFIIKKKTNLSGKF